MRSFDTSKSHEELLGDVSLAWRTDAATLAKSGRRTEADEILVNLAKKSQR